MARNAAHVFLSLCEPRENYDVILFGGHQPKAFDQIPDDDELSYYHAAQKIMSDYYRKIKPVLDRMDSVWSEYERSAAENGINHAVTVATRLTYSQLSIQMRDVAKRPKRCEIASDIRRRMSDYSSYWMHKAIEAELVRSGIVDIAGDFRFAARCQDGCIDMESRRIHIVNESMNTNFRLYAQQELAHLPRKIFEKFSWDSLPSNEP